MENIKNLFISGGRGYIGSNVINTLYDRYPNINFIVVGLTDSNERKTINKNIVNSKRYKYYKVNIGNEKKIMKIFNKYKIEYILDLAAFLPWKLLEVSQEEYIQNNISDRNAFFNTCVKYGKIKHILYQSSILAFINSFDNYGSSKNIYPKNTYENIIYTTTKSSGLSLAYSKLIMEKLPITIISPSHIYGGKNQHIEDNINVYTKELCETNQITLGINSNKNYDNWINVNDVIEAYVIIFNQGYNKKNYNLFNSKQYYTSLDLAKIIIKSIKNTNEYSKYIKYNSEFYTFTPNLKDYNLFTNFLPNQFTTQNNFIEEVKKIAKC